MLDSSIWMTSKHSCLYVDPCWFADFQITSGYLISCFFRLSSGETTTNVKDSTLTVFFFILSTWRNYSSLLFCKHSLRLFNFSLILSSSGELLSSDQGIIQKKSASGSRTLPCLVIFFRNFILIWKCQKWYLNRGTLVLVTKQSAPLQV